MRAVALAVILVVSAATARADTDPLAEAMRLEATLDYEGALSILERVIAQGGADRDRLVTLHLFAGRMAAGLDRPAVAEDHFARVLALAPTTKLADGFSPKIVEPFDRARGRTAPLRISVESKPDAITIVPEADPLALVAGIAVTLDDGRELREMQKRRIAIPSGRKAAQVTALDAFGNRLWSQPVTADTPGGTTITTLRPTYARWPFWATATVIAVGVGGVSAWRFDVSRDEWNRRNGDSVTPFSTLKDIEARVERWALAANLSFAAAGATTLIAIFTAARGSTTSAVVTAQPNTIGLVVAGSF